MRGAGNIASVFMFASCVSLGVLFRRKAATHKRLMLMASIPVLAPALDRLARIPALNEFSARTLYWLAEPPEVAFALICFLLLLITMVVRDLATERRLHQGTIWGLVAIFVFALVETYAFTASGAWVAFVRMIA